MRRAFAFAVLLLLLIPCSSAFAQSRTTIEARVVTTCGTISPTYNAGPPNLVTIDVNGNLCVNVNVALPSNQSVNVAQFGGVSTATGQVAVSVAPVTATNTALVVDLRPDSPGIIPLGQATKANSVPVTFASDQDVCSYGQKSSVAIAITTATTTSLVAVSGTTSVYVCGFSFSASNVVTTANILTFEYGTGAACTGTHALTGGYGTGSVLAAAPSHYSFGNGTSTVFSAPSANGICAVTTIGASGSFEGVLTYVQQ